MQDGVLDAADVLIDGEPVLRGLRVERSAVVVRVGVAVEIPGRIDERVHGIGFAARRTAALGAGRVDELRQFAERRSAGERDLDILRQNHGQIFFRHGNDAVFFAIKHGNRRAPIALARNSPIFQAIGDGGFAEAMFLGVRGHFLDRVGALKPAERAGVDQHALRARQTEAAARPWFLPDRSRSEEPRGGSRACISSRTRSRARRARARS